MTFTLGRFCYSPFGTFGRLRTVGFECYTVEEVWADNATGRSCIPEGTYLCRRGRYPRHGETFEVMHVPLRTAILFHIANTIDDIEGCIGPGEALGWVAQKWAVVNSRAAYERFMDRLVGASEFFLTIKQYHP